jgi:hypothetical protein
MKMRSFLGFFLLFSLFWGSSARSQQSSDGLSGTPKVIKKTDPVYPPIARAAHVSGDVKLKVQIDAKGHVVGSTAISGPAMLVGAAQDCVKQWVYETEGTPKKTEAIITISFTLPMALNPDDEKIAAKFFPLDQACKKAVSSSMDAAQQAEACRAAAEMAEKFSPQERFIERRSAFVYASAAFRRNKQFSESLDYANKAVAVVEQGHDDGSGTSAVYSTRAQVYAELGDLAKSSADLTKAEQFEREAIAKMMPLDAEFTKRQYIPNLRGMLNFHARILTALGDTQGSEAKTNEAAQL